MNNKINSLIVGVALLTSSDIARSATLTWVKPALGDGNHTSNRMPQQVSGNGDHNIITQHAQYTLTDSWTVPRINDLLSHHRIRARSQFGSHFQNDFSVAHEYNIPRNSSSIVVTTRDAAHLVVFFNAAAVRGPPQSSDQSLYLFDNAPDNPVLHLCNAPPSLRVQSSRFIVNTQRDSPAQPCFRGERGWCLAGCSHSPIKYHPTVHLKELL